MGGQGGSKEGGLGQSAAGLKAGASDSSAFLNMILGAGDHQTASGALGTKPAFEAAMGGSAPTGASFDLGSVIGKMLGNVVSSKTQPLGMGANMIGQGLNAIGANTLGGAMTSIGTTLGAPAAAAGEGAAAGGLSGALSSLLALL